MAFETVNPATGIWLGRGLRYLLLQEDLNTFSRADSPVREIPDRLAARRPPAPKRMEATQRPEPKKAPDWKPVPEADWPPEWQAQFGLTKRGKVVWTYANLGKDLAAGKNSGQADTAEEAQARARRSQMLRNLIGALGYPAGTHTFWPCQLGDAVQSDLFWSGVRALGSRGVIILGVECACALLESAGARPFTAKIFRGQKAMVLRALEDYSDADTGQIVSFLRSSLAQIVR